MIEDAIPSVQVRPDAPHTTPSSAALGATAAQVVIDGSGWPVGVAVRVFLEVSEDDGVTWQAWGNVLTSKNDLDPAMKCHIGVIFNRPIESEVTYVRGVVQTIGGNIDLIGVVRVI